MGSTILGAGHYVPQRRITNDELEERLGLAPGWIERRTGIRERRYAADDEALSDLAVKAGEHALSRVAFDRKRIGLLLLATSTPDHLLPPSAPLVAHRLCLANAGAIDLAGACTGFIYALTFADTFVRQRGDPVLVIAANILSRRTNPDDRSSVILFGDAAGAVLLAPSRSTRSGVAGIALSSDGSAYDRIQIPAGGSRQPFDPSTPLQATWMHMPDGRAVFARAVKMMSEAAAQALAQAGLTASDVDLWLPHQANSRIMKAVQERLGIGDEKAVSCVALYGNSSAATIPLALSLEAEERILKPGMALLMTAAGAGMTSGAVVFRL